MVKFGQKMSVSTRVGTSRWQAGMAIDTPGNFASEGSSGVGQTPRGGSVLSHPENSWARLVWGLGFSPYWWGPNPHMQYV